jgi:hypothetical protein
MFAERLWEWWAWLIVGLALAVLSIVAGWWDRRHSDHRHRELRSGQETIASGLVMLAQMTGVQADKSTDDIAIAVATKIRALQTQVENLTSLFWRRLTHREIQLLTGHLRHIGNGAVRILADGQLDCHELTGDLVRAFKEAQWDMDWTGEKEIPLSIYPHAGIHILGKYEDPQQRGSKVMHVLQPFIGGGIGYVAALPDEDTADVVICVWPKPGRSSLPSIK